jgi:hypothetical protein
MEDYQRELKSLPVDKLTICDDCGVTIAKPPTLQFFEILPLCGACMLKQIDTY